MDTSPENFEDGHNSFITYIPRISLPECCQSSQKHATTPSTWTSQSRTIDRVTRPYYVHAPQQRSMFPQDLPCGNEGLSVCLAAIVRLVPRGCPRKPNTRQSRHSPLLIRGIRTRKQREKNHRLRPDEIYKAIIMWNRLL